VNSPRVGVSQSGRVSQSGSQYSQSGRENRKETKEKKVIKEKKEKKEIQPTITVVRR